ncbi:predicted protein [Histoplasma capsulatum var. duboisii H88]|uniref:Predicted protein n=1 Tax=Ajellomyces capsulatus (strain H88) TaxID=544711 RepID=F0U920_AJEC8|nr:predicted protein [Histoplasma capsulatum var. duboisii H88]
MAVRGRQPPILLQVTTRQGVLFTFPQILLVHVQYIYRAGDVLRLKEDNFILFYPPLACSVNRLPRLAAADGGRWKKSSHNRSWNAKEHQYAGEDTSASSIPRSSPQISSNPLLQDVRGLQAEIDDLKVRLRKPKAMIKNYDINRGHSPVSWNCRSNCGCSIGKTHYPSSVTFTNE